MQQGVQTLTEFNRGCVTATLVSIFINVSPSSIIHGVLYEWTVLYFESKPCFPYTNRQIFWSGDENPLRLFYMEKKEI